MGVKCFLPDSGVEEFPALSTEQLEQAAAELAAADGLLLVHAEDPGRAGGRARAGRAVLRAVPRVAAGAGRGHRDRDGRSPRPGVPASGCTWCTCPAPPRCPRSRPPGPTGSAVTVETCPHYLVLEAEQVPDGATAAKCCPPVRGDGQPGRTLGRARRRDHRPGGQRPLAVAPPTSRRWTPATSAPPGAASRRCSSGCRWSGPRPAGAATTWPTSCAGCRRRPRPWSGSAPRAASGSVRPPIWWPSRPDAELVVDPARLHHRNPVSPYTGARLTGVVRSTWLAGTLVGRTSGTGRPAAGAEGRRDGAGPARAARPRGAHASAAPSSGPTTSCSPGGRTSSPRGRLSSPRAPSAPRARSTTAGRPGAGATSRPGTPTRRSSGWARRAWCGPWSSTPATSPATSRARRRSTGVALDGAPSVDALRAADWTPLVERSAAEGRHRERLPGRLAAALDARAAEHLPRRRRGPAAGARRGGRRPAAWSRRSAPSTSRRSSSAAGSPAAATCSTARRTG